ncbi:response regulator transcription factor [Microvirga sp. VF16]|nr:response regulator transcription factor [Microvirga sp. VF16]
MATLEKLRIACPSVRLVMMADDLPIQEVVQLCQVGLGGICPTTMPRSSLLKVLELVMLGGTFLPGSVSVKLLQQVSGRRVHEGSPAPATGETGRLTARETQILRCLTQGASNKIIARELDLSEATVKVHIKAILRKVRAENRTQAAIWAQEHMAFAPSTDAAVA